jgi:RNA polymerase sigma-70 factor (ECF subfamily)
MLNIAAHHPSALSNRCRDSSPTSNLDRCGSWTTLADTNIDPQEEPPIALARWLEQEGFRGELEALVPQLRAFARSLCGKRDVADDLVQDALLKAWAARDRYRPGTNMRAWVFIILRNVFLSQKRRDRFKGEWNQEIADRTLCTPANQEKQLQLADLQRALTTLPPAQREALILVGAGGLAYEEAAEICGCAVGTVKSRVARARAALEAMMSMDACPPRARTEMPADRARESILGEVTRAIA